jgi:hypothetical protein
MQSLPRPHRMPDSRLRPTRTLQHKKRGPRFGTLQRSNGLATYGHHRPMTLLTPLRQLILCSGLILCRGTFLPPVAFDCLALPPACCVEEHSHRDVKDGEAELCCRHGVAFPT